ncbi:MAG: radical SAM protein [Candidatus Omnitrophica bacterium]|nr:radical SAM protein [Candidatus Omnitrophota bacterium]
MKAKRHKFRVAKIDRKEVPWDPSQLRIIKAHPCYSEKACHLFGRMHLPLAPKCNIQCKYCDRRYDCVNESRPGITSKVLTPKEAIEKTREVLKDHPYIKVLAVAGPGEPLFNEETFEFFRLAKEEFPNITRCVSTNGLLLPEKMDELVDLGVITITVTLNAIDPEIGKEIYEFVNFHGKMYKGREAAEILIENQLKGIKEAVKRRKIIKINTVYIPTINDKHVAHIAKEVSKMGVYIQNVIPLIPLYKFSQINPPTIQEKLEIQKACSGYVKQMRHCRQCRADAIGKLGKDIQHKLG